MACSGTALLFLRRFSVSLHKCIHQRFSTCGTRPPGGGHCSLGGGVDCIRGIPIFNEIYVQDKIYILVHTLLG
jgi:hypothetical protein